MADDDDKATFVLLRLSFELLGLFDEFATDCLSNEIFLIFFNSLGLRRNLFETKEKNLVRNFNYFM